MMSEDDTPHRREGQSVEGQSAEARDPPVSSTASVHDSGARALRHRPFFYHQFVGSTPAEVRQTLICVIEELRAFGLNRHDLEAAEMVLAECMNNVVEHAYDQQPGRRFELKLLLTSVSLFCRVEDQGQPMPDLMMPPGRLADLSTDLDELPEGGFGWFLIRELTSDLNYARTDGLIRLSFQIPLGRSD